MIPSSTFSCFSVPTDGARKERHNREVMYVLSLLRKNGISEYNLHHIQDVGLNTEIPIAIGSKIYDIGYVSADGEIFMIEIMRTGIKWKSQNTK